jgi:hypothetical protein
MMFGVLFGVFIRMIGAAHPLQNEFWIKEKRLANRLLKDKGQVKIVPDEGCGMVRLSDWVDPVLNAEVADGEWDDPWSEWWVATDSVASNDRAIGTGKLHPPDGSWEDDPFSTSGSTFLPSKQSICVKLLLRCACLRRKVPERTEKWVRANKMAAERGHSCTSSWAASEQVKLIKERRHKTDQLRKSNAANVDVN